MSAATTPDLLETIVAATRRVVALRSEATPIARLERAAQAAAVQPRGAAFDRALRSSDAPRVIAECKRRSPSKGILRSDYRPGEHARAYADAGAAAISVLTEPTFFDGSLDHLRAVRAAVDVPVLRKDFIVEEYQLFEAVAAGADAVLLIVAALDQQALAQLLGLASTLGLAALVEVHAVEEVSRACDAGATIVGVNSRNLRTLSVDLTVLYDVAVMLPPGIVPVAESGIRTRADIDKLSFAGYKAFLVGERLMTQADPGRALRELRG